MSNWYSTSFKTTDKDIIKIITSGQIINFYYDEELGAGHCELRWGFAAIDLNNIAKIAEEHKSDIYIVARDCMTNTEQELEIKNGIKIICESRRKEFKWEEYEINVEDQHES